MSQRLPAETSALVAINVSKVLASPYAKEQQWAETMADSWAKRPQMVPPGVSRLLMGADVAPSTMESIWEVCLMEMRQVPDAQTLAAKEGGFIDRVWDKDAAVSPVNAYFIPLSDEQMLATATPGERRTIARWLRQPLKPEGAVTSDYINSILPRLGEHTHIVMAIDLEGAFGVPNIRRFLEQSENPDLMKHNLDALAATIGSLRGIALEIKVNDKVNGKASIDFEKDAASLDSVAKGLMIEALIYAGMNLEELDQWTFSTKDKQVTAEGELSTESLRRLLGVVQSPVPAVVAAAPADTTSSASQEPAVADPATASQRYYKAVAASLDSFREGASMSATASWLKHAAKRIDQLPILNVDPELIEWGALVSSKLKQAAAALAVHQTQTNSRVAGVMNPEYGGYYDADNNYRWGHVDRIARENARNERRREALDQKAKGHEQALKILDELTGKRQEVRAAMAAKYGVEF
jgi:hypothetical protein